jgi:hypothetical protein
MEIVDVIVTGMVLEDTGVNAVHAPASGAAGVKRKARASFCSKEEDWIDLTGNDGGHATARSTGEAKGRMDHGKRLATDAKAQTASEGGSSSAGGSSGSSSASWSASDAKAKTASKGGSSSAGGGSGKKQTKKQSANLSRGQKGNQDEFNKNEVAYAEMLWPLLDVDGDGEVTLEALESVIARARAKGFSANMSQRDVRDMFNLAARHNKDNTRVLTETDVKRIVKETKMHHKR